MKNDDMRKMVKMENLVPIILGVALSGLGTLMNFAYSNIEELHSEVVEHRLLLSRLISPDGKLIQSPTSAASKTAINKEISDLKKDIAVLQTKMDYINPDWLARIYKYSHIAERKFWFEDEYSPTEQEKYNLGIMYWQGLSRENKPMYVLAYYWLSLSNDPRAKKNLDYLRSQMTPDQIKKAQDLIAKHEITKGLDKKGEL